MTLPVTIAFQSAKLGSQLAPILAEFEWAGRLLEEEFEVGRIYGVSGGALPALAFALALAARRDPARWGAARGAVDDCAGYLRRAGNHGWRTLNLNPLYGFYHLRPLRRWIAARLQAYGARADVMLSELGVPLYLCAGDEDATLTLFGPPDESLQFQYHYVHVGPPGDAPVVPALCAALGTILRLEPAQVNGRWYRDARPAVVDAGAIVADLEAADPRPIRRTRPHAPVGGWTQNWITSSFIMHSQNERNQTLLAAYYLDLRERQRALSDAYRSLQETAGEAPPEPRAPHLGHVDLPYIGSTEAFTNMRESVQRKDALMARFRELLQGQLDTFPFDRPANVLYGAGGFSGILGGLVTTRAVDAGFANGGGEVRQVYGVSAGVLNGFFHAVQLAAARHPDLYTAAARDALSDLEAFMARVEPKKIAGINLNPVRFWQGWAHLGPLESFMLERLSAYTGSRHPAAITFDDIGLPLTVAAARRDGFTDFLGVTAPERRMCFGGQAWRVQGAPVVRAIIAGWSMNTYVAPTSLNGQHYCDGGGTFYDPALFAACLDEHLTGLLNIHLDQPDGGTYRIPPRPNLLRLLFDTHNYYFPEERRRMRLLTELLYEHYRLRACYASLLARAAPEVAAAHPLPPDFRREWELAD